MAVSISVATQAVYPPRVLVTVTGLTTGDEVVVERFAQGDRTMVRPGVVTATGSTALVLDAELPFGVPVRHSVSVNGGARIEADPVTYTLPGGKVVLSDAISAQAAEAVIMAWPDEDTDYGASVYTPGRRNVVVSTGRGQSMGSIELLVESTSSLANLLALLGNATEGIIQIRSAEAAEYEGIDRYLVVTGDRVSRFSQSGRDPRRLVTIDYATVDGWPSAWPAVGATYGDMTTAYAGLDYAAVAADYATYLALAQEGVF